jgi:transposase
LAEGERSGRPRRLSQKQLEEVSHMLRRNPMDFGLNVSLWDGKALSELVARHWGIPLGVRQSQRLFRQLGFPRK